MKSFVISASRSGIVNYISSPEVNFLRSIVTQFKESPTKLIFHFLGQNDIEPTTNQTYNSLLVNLTYIKTFASGILVPKTYIWPLDRDLYLRPHTSVVLDAHSKGLEVFASDFSNDVPFAYDYNYDPVAECLNFIDNGNFSVDGMLSDFPITPSEAIGIFLYLVYLACFILSITILTCCFYVSTTCYYARPWFLIIFLEAILINFQVMIT